MPKHTHVIEADTFQEFCEEVQKLSATLGQCAASVAPVGCEADPIEHTEPVEPTVSAPKEEAVKKTRKKKVEEPVAPAEPAVVVDGADDVDPFGEEITPKPHKAATFDEVKAALQLVVSNKGMDKARELLKTYGFERITQIREVQYADFIEACEKAAG